ncbi:class I SAM-dependent RNA methyltransferase [Mangrovicella endophytica]|uniref:class I SAM-dependent RNA methyltransferase n=1 Tax=Mangrovicella endophytica TaxID=2066697 RepID=UPI000C9DD35F|nr:class I SAM-dependent RNA methyltransferase [Mangrovicella endophytica]
MTQALTIDRLGAKADGIGSLPDGGQAFVPFTLPGERVLASGRGPRFELERVETPSPERVEPPCPHFGICGGCDLQHASDAVYHAFKRDLVVEAFRRVGIDAPVDDLVPCPPHSRRRVTLSAVRAGNGVLLGYNEALSHRIVDIKVCPIALPEIERALPGLRQLAGLAVDRRRPLRLTVTVTASGLDVALADAAPLNERLRQNLVRFAVEAGLARLSSGGEVLLESRPPVIDIDGIAVSPPPGGFLQAVASAEAQMATRALGHLKGARQVADLFAGVGTFSLRLARQSAVHAVESDAPALAALDAAQRHTRGLKPLTSERRDLFRRPLNARELKRFDGLVFDPPRAGAEAQSREVAGSSVARVAAISCNPTTLARDVAILVAGGYRLDRVTPIDQFLWSHHVEAVALLSR